MTASPSSRSNHAIAAPFCTCQLADLGARVIKVERPGVGDFARAYDQRVGGLASHFVWVNRSKESLTLNLRQPAALAVLRQLIATADVLVQNLAPGAAARMGLGYDALSAAHPALIVCDISGCGDNGSYRDKKAYDLLIQSEAGFLSVTGTPDAPSRSGNSIADIAAGMYAHSSILAALIQRDKRGGTGQGAHIDVSMLELLTEWMGYPMSYSCEGAALPPRSAASHATIYPYGPFLAGDGGTVMLGLQNEREWKLFCGRVLHNMALSTDPRFDSNARRNEHRCALQTILLTTFASLSTAAVLARLDDAQIANACMDSMADVWAHPRLQARERGRRVGRPAGDIPALLPPGRISSFDHRIDPVPAVGEHSQSILRALGHGDAEIAALMRATPGWWTLTSMTVTLPPRFCATGSRWCWTPRWTPWRDAAGRHPPGAQFLFVPVNRPTGLPTLRPAVRGRCIDPAQVMLASFSVAPSVDEVNGAQRVLTRSQHHPIRVFTQDGHTVDAPVSSWCSRAGLGGSPLESIDQRPDQ